MALGTAFDTDPLLPWAAEILARKDSARKRVAALHGRALEHLKRVSGRDGSQALKAVLRVRKAPYEVLCDPESPSEEALRSRLRAIHPTRCVELEGVCSWPVFFAHLDRVATEAKLTTPAARALCAVYMCLLGGHFTADPQHPWLRRGLDAARTANADSAARILLEDGKTWVDRALPLMSSGAR
jgi:hypothetical protein